MSRILRNASSPSSLCQPSPFCILRTRSRSSSRKAVIVDVVNWKWNLHSLVVCFTNVFLFSSVCRRLLQLSAMSCPSPDDCCGWFQWLRVSRSRSGRLSHLLVCLPVLLWVAFLTHISLRCVAIRKACSPSSSSASLCVVGGARAQRETKKKKKKKEKRKMLNGDNQNGSTRVQSMCQSAVKQTWMTCG